MAIGYHLASIRTAMLGLIVTRAGNGALLQGYTAPRPATGAAVTSQTLLFQETCGTPFGSVTGDVLTITNPTPANALVTGTWVWWRVVQSDGTTFVMDGAASDFTLSGTETQAGQPVTLTGLTITEGNP
jgi:hypothetical protein